MAVIASPSPPGSLEKKILGENDLDLPALARVALNESEFSFLLKPKDIARAANCEKRTAYGKASRLYARARDALSVVSEEKKTPLMQDLLISLDKRTAALAPLAGSAQELDEADLSLESPRPPSLANAIVAGGGLPPSTSTAALPASVPPTTSVLAPSAPTITTGPRVERSPSGGRGIIAKPPSVKTAFLRPDLRASRPHVLIAKNSHVSVKPESPPSPHGKSPIALTASNPNIALSSTPPTSSPLSHVDHSSAPNLPVAEPVAPGSPGMTSPSKADVTSVIEFKPLPDQKSWVELLRQTAKRKQVTVEEKPIESPAKPILMSDPAAKKRRATVTTKLHVKFLEEATLCLFAPQSPPKAIRQADDAAEEDYFSRHLEEPNEQQLTAIYEQALLCVLCPLNQNLPLAHGQTVPEKVRSEHFIRVVRSCFAVTTQQHELYLSAVQNVSNPGYILAGLRTQFEALDNHIFYAKINYEPQDANFVDIWKERERARINQVIVKLLEENPSLMTVNPDNRRMSRSVMFSPLQNFHDLYKILISSLYIYDLNQPPADVDPKTVLSRHSLWLLDEYARRYSIAPLYRKIVFLNIIAFEGFELALNRIWLEIIELLKAGEKMNLVERHVFTSLIDKLHLEVKGRLSKVFSRFNDLSPLVSVRLNVGILEMLSQVDAMMQGQGTTSCADLLYEYTRVSLANRYQQLLAYENDPAARNTEQQKVWKAHKEEHIIATPSQLVEVCNLILSSSKIAKEFRAIYKDYFDVLPLVQLGYANFFSENVQTFCKYYCFAYPPSEVLDLCGKIKQINKRFQRKLPAFEPIPLTLFAPFVYSWIGEMHQRLIKAGAEFCRSQKPDETTRYASAVDEFFNTCTAPVSFLTEQSYFDPCAEPEKKDSFLHRYGKAVAKSLTIFIEHIYNNFLDVLPSEDKRELRETFFLKEDKAQVAKINALMRNSRDCARFTKTKRNELLGTEFFVRLSTLERIDTFLEELGSKLPSGVDLLIDPKKTLRRATNHVTGMIVFWLEANINARATEFMQEKSIPKTPKVKLQPTFDYLFQQVSLMSVLSDKTFRALLTTWWEKTTQFVHAALLNQAVGADPKTAKAGQALTMKLAEQFLEELKNLFVANGRGVPLATVDRQIEKLFTQIKAVSKFTEPSIARNSSKGQEGLNP